MPAVKGTVAFHIIQGAAQLIQLIIRQNLRGEFPCVRQSDLGLDPGKRKDFEEFVNANANDIVEKWTDYFIKKKHIVPKIITQKVRNVRTIG